MSKTMEFSVGTNFQKKSERHRRDWNFEDGILELRGDDAVQHRKLELRAERRQDYNDYKNQVQIQLYIVANGCV